MLKKHFFTSVSYLLFAVLLLASCAPKQVVTRSEFTFDGQHAPVPYTLHKLDKPVNKTLLYLPPAIDSFNFEGTEVFTKLLKDGYEIVTIMAPSKGDFYGLRSMNFASQRQSEIISTARHLKKTGQAQFEHLHILGIEEGAYLSPTVAIQLIADTVIFVNAGPFNPLVEIERLGQKDSLSPVESAFLQENFGLDSASQVATMVKNMKFTYPDKILLGMQTNKYWLSFGAENISELYPNIEARCYWLHFEDYPLSPASNLSYIKLLNGMQASKGNATFSLKGDGNLKSKSAEVLSKKLEEILIGG